MGDTSIAARTHASATRETPVRAERPALAEAAGADAIGARGRRVLYLLLGVWLLNLFDLSLTLRAWGDGMLHEENPLARVMLQRDPAVLLAFKLSVVGAGTTVLFNLRRFRCAEVASMLVLLVYAGVAVQWKFCYELYELSLTAAMTPEDSSRLEGLGRILPIF